MSWPLVTRGRGIAKGHGIESRGFILGGTLAARLGAGFVPVKPGKLPADVYEVEYNLEYGSSVLAIHPGCRIAESVC